MSSSSLLSHPYFPSRAFFHSTELTYYLSRSRRNIAGALLSMTESSQRFFHPSETDAMLEAFLPMMDGNNINVSLCLLSLSICLY